MSDESVKNWQGFVSEKPQFASMLYRWMCLLGTAQEREIYVR